MLRSVKSPNNTVASYVATSFLLGIVLGLGVGSFIWGSSLSLLGLWLVSLAIFHFSEFFFVVMYHPSEVKWSCKLSNISYEYSEINSNFS